MAGNGTGKAMNIKNIYRKLCPYGIRKKIYKLRVRLHMVKSYEKGNFQKIQTGMYMEIQKEECEYMIKEGKTLVFPYPWTKEHRPESIQVYTDKKKHMSYIILNEGGAPNVFSACLF